MLERVFSIDIKAPAQRVWDEITRRGVVHHAMFGTVLHGEMRPGEVISYRSVDGKHTFVVGELIEVSPPTRLVHTFRFSLEKDPPTLVTWALKESGGSTRVTVTHERFIGETRSYKSVTSGWPRILALYKQEIETGRVPMGARFKNGMMGVMSFMLPKGARTENALAESVKLP